jgi:hypothetical protein
MIEFRTTTTLKEAPELLPLLEKLIERIDPGITLQTETARRTMLIRIHFPVQGELEIFLAALQERGIKLHKTGVMSGASIIN